MSYILMIIPPERFRDEELFVTKEELEKFGHKITVASTKKGDCPGSRGGFAEAEYDINEFIDEFILKLKQNCSDNNIELRHIKMKTKDVLSVDSLMKNFNPNGIVEFGPTQFYTHYRGLITKTGLFFKYNLSFRQDNKSKFVQLFSTRIGVITDSFETAGIPAANDIFNKMAKSGFILVDKPTKSTTDYFD